MDKPVLVQLKALYASFDASSLSSLPSIYTPQVVFQDPVQQITGLESLKEYFHQMMSGLTECRFEFNGTVTQVEPEDLYQSALYWTMYYRHPKLESGRLLTLQGSSHIKYGEQIYYHRDYFDLGAMLYERVPLLGTAVRSIKKRLEA